MTTRCSCTARLYFTISASSKEETLAKAKEILDSIWEGVSIRLDDYPQADMRVYPEEDRAWLDITFNDEWEDNLYD